ncbi:MAG: polysaccharide deacetylase family protein [Bryobacterales bacterium]|nr:polysaccharide deacetylase family protein [Bryobacterales bacterium]
MKPVIILLAAAVLPLPAAEPIRLILHADDVGMSHSTNRAAIEMLEAGAVSSASIMMPCPWVSEIAEYARKHPEKDLGLHLTLTSEWRVYRWGPVAPRDKVPGLLDPDGYLWRRVEDVATHATAAEVETELRAQIAKATQHGIRFTHFDTHMGTLYARPDYFQVFEKLGREFNVPILRMKPDPSLAAEAPKTMMDWLAANEERFQREGYFRLDTLLTNPTRGVAAEAARRAAYHAALRALKPGVTMMILHPAVLDEELRAVTGSHTQRNGDYRIFLEAETRELMRALGIQLVGWRDVAGRK